MENKNNNNVIGPFTRGDWNALRMLKVDIANYKLHNQDGKYNDAIVSDQNITKALLSKYIAA
jgi:hypothetical protein